MAGALYRYDACVRPQVQILSRQPHRNDAVEPRLAGDDKRGHVNLRKLRAQVQIPQQANAACHPFRREHVAERRPRVPQRRHGASLSPGVAAAISGYMRSDATQKSGESSLGERR